MATEYDVAYLRLVVQQQLAGREQAMACLQWIDEQQEQGRTLSAAQAAIERRLRQWQYLAVNAWDEWFALAERLSPALSRLVGAHPELTPFEVKAILRAMAERNPRAT